MKVEIEDIRAWVDGELDEPQAGQVRNAVLSDKRLKQTADKLHASQLPYREAYEKMPMPDVPESLRAKIEALRNPTVANPTVTNPTVENPTVENNTVHNPGTNSPNIENLPNKAANNSSFKMIGIAASVIIAALIGHLGYLAGANTVTQAAPDASASVETQHTENFARTVAAYQKFYVRETLQGAVAPNPVKVADRLANQTGMQVIIPEFEGYKFMRAQRLSIDGELLLQLVYLGAEGGPLALCYIAAVDGETGSEQNNTTGTTTLQNHHGLNTAEWQHNGHRFVIVSDAPEETLTELSQSTRQQWNG